MTNVELTDYERDNLLALLHAVGGFGIDPKHPRGAQSPMSGGNTGDWVGQVATKLGGWHDGYDPGRPNKTAAEIAQAGPSQVANMGDAEPREDWDEIYEAAIAATEEFAEVPSWVLILAVNAAVDTAQLEPAGKSSKTKLLRQLTACRRTRDAQGRRIAAAKAEAERIEAIAVRVRDKLAEVHRVVHYERECHEHLCHMAVLLADAEVQALGRHPIEVPE